MTPEQLVELAYPYETDGIHPAIIDLYRKIWLKGYYACKFNNETVDVSRRTYFKLRDILHAEGNTGYSKIELHELAKKDILPKLIENPDNFNDSGKEGNKLSVTWLSDQGWKSYIEEFKLWTAENFNFYL